MGYCEVLTYLICTKFVLTGLLMYLTQIGWTGQPGMNAPETECIHVFNER